MPRRYRRTSVGRPVERIDVPLLAFPAGEGPAVAISAVHGQWRRLGLDEGVLVTFDRTGAGAFAWGMVASRALVCVWLDGGDNGVAYCHHCRPGPLDPAVFSRALRDLECPATERINLYVVIAAPGDVAASDERFFVSAGVRGDRIFTYSKCLSPQFGVSAKGCVGEVR